MTFLFTIKHRKDHFHNLEEVLKFLHDQSFFAKLSKCEFGLTQLLYLGQIIGQDGVKLDMEKIRAILECPRPKSLTKLRGFIGIFTYYREFVKGFSQLHLSPIWKRNMLSNGMKGLKNISK